MAEKHKSKYKAPKDLEKSQKPKPRKDLKDYTVEDKDEKLNPKSTGEKQKNVLRKTDKEVIDNGSLVPDLKDADRAYKPDGEYDPKHAAKVMSKRQEDDEKENKDNIKDKIENLTREQKERLVREYIRRRIKNVLKEQEETEEPVPAEEPIAEPATEPAPEAPTAEPAVEPAPAPAEPAAPEAPVDATQGLEKQYIEQLRASSPSAMDLVKHIMKLGVQISADYEYDDRRNFYKLLKLSADKLFSKSAIQDKE